MLSKIISDSACVKESLDYRVMSGKGPKEENDKYFDMLDKIISDSVQIKNTFGYRLKHIPESVLLSEQDEALKDPGLAYLFAFWIPGANIEKCQGVACKDPRNAFLFARDIKTANIEKCCKASCVNAYYSYNFAKFIYMKHKKELQEAVKDNILINYLYCKLFGIPCNKPTPEEAANSYYSVYFLKEVVNIHREAYTKC